MLYDNSFQRRCTRRGGLNAVMEFRALRDRAHHLVAHNRPRKALAVYEELIRRAPSDPQLRIRYGELARRLGRTKESVQAYLAAAELLAADGHAARAQAAVKLAATADPNHPAVAQALGRLAAANAPSSASCTPERTCASTVSPTPVRNTSADGPARMRSVTLELEVIDVPIEALTGTSRGAEGPAQIKRISANAIAYRPVGEREWMIFSSAAPIRLSFSAECPEADDADAGASVPEGSGAPRGARA